jgi:hypothetical protein
VGCTDLATLAVVLTDLSALVALWVGGVEDNARGDGWLCFQSFHIKNLSKIVVSLLNSKKTLNSTPMGLEWLWLVVSELAVDFLADVVPTTIFVVLLGFFPLALSNPLKEVIAVDKVVSLNLANKIVHLNLRGVVCYALIILLLSALSSLLFIIFWK